MHNNSSDKNNNLPSSHFSQVSSSRLSSLISSPSALSSFLTTSLHSNLIPFSPLFSSHLFSSLLFSPLVFKGAVGGGKGAPSSNPSRMTLKKLNLCGERKIVLEILGAAYTLPPLLSSPLLSSPLLSSPLLYSTLLLTPIRFLNSFVTPVLTVSALCCAFW